MVPVEKDLIGLPGLEAEDFEAERGLLLPSDLDDLVIIVGNFGGLLGLLSHLLSFEISMDSVYKW